MEETLSITDQGTTVEFLLYWYRRHASITFREGDSAGMQSKMMMKASPEILRTIADQFFSWAETIESDQPASPALPDTPPRND